MLTLTANNLILRDMKLADLEPLRHWLQPEHEWHKTNGPYYPRSTPEEVDETIRTWEQAITAGKLPDLRRRLVIADGGQDTVMGLVTRYWISKETHWIATGIMIFDPKNWGKGVGYQALGLWCQYLFDTQPLFVRLDLRTWSGNYGMMKLATKLGFKKEAVFRMARIVEGEYYDGLGYGVLRTEWEERYPKGFTASLSI